MADPTSDGAASFSTQDDLPADRHGRAALLLAESLIHALLEKKLLTVAEAVEIVDVATEVEREAAAATDGGRPPHLQKSLLAPLANSLRGDLG